MPRLRLLLTKLTLSPELIQQTPYNTIQFNQQQLSNMRSSLLNPHDQSSPSLPKLKCAFHPQELLTNFCSSRQCLLPLCPSCIRIHINEHMTMKTTPQLENIHDSIRQLHQHLEKYSQKVNGIYKRVVQVETKVEEMKENFKGKIHYAKQQLIEAVQEHFKRVQVNTMKKINELSYVKCIAQYKEYSKKMVLGLKNAQRNFFAQESKVMRMIIKFQSNQLQAKLDAFCKDSQLFTSFNDSNFFSLKLKENIPELTVDFLKPLCQVDFAEPPAYCEPKDLIQVIKELYEKPVQKRDMKKSISKFVSNKNTPKKLNISVSYQNRKNYDTLQPDLQQFAEHVSTNHGISLSHLQQGINDLDFVPTNAYNSISYDQEYASVKQSIDKATKEFNNSIRRNSRLQNSVQPASRGSRKSISRGKGISLIQSTHAPMERRASCLGSLLETDLNLNLINRKTQHIPRRFR